MKTKSYVCRGIGCLPPSKRKKIARMGAQAINERGLSYKWDSKSAKAASKKGVAARRKNKKI